TFIKSENLMKNSSVRGIPLNHNYNRFFSYLTDFFKTLSFSIDSEVFHMKKQKLLPILFLLFEGIIIIVVG
ncbi:hypothetical protein, partial [Streptococcus equi]